MNQALHCIYWRKHSWSLWVRWQSDPEIENSFGAFVWRIIFQGFGCICLIVWQIIFFRSLALILLFLSVQQELHFPLHPWFYLSPFCLVIRAGTGERCCFFLPSICPTFPWCSILFHFQFMSFSWSDSTHDSRGGMWPGPTHQNLPPSPPQAQWLLMVKYTTQSQWPETILGLLLDPLKWENASLLKWLKR